MKLTLLFLLLFSAVSYSQENSLVKQNQGVNGNPQAQSEHDSLRLVQVFNDSINYQIGLVDSHLNSIQIKWDWIINNPEEKIIADDTDWFVKMTAIKQELEEKKQLLLNSLQQ